MDNDLFIHLNEDMEKERPPPSHRGVVTKAATSSSEKQRSTDVPSKSTESKNNKKLEDKPPAKKDNVAVEGGHSSQPEDGQFQLNDLMTKMLEEELQTIMIEVWRALPDDPPTDVEKFVVDKIRNEISDDLRNAIGLNVTKRLLNVYNPLIVKLYFSCRPQSGCLTKFLNTYNIKSFKRLSRESNIFAARLPTIDDFDRICTAKDIRCGTAKIRVSPCYKFTKCPEKLNTIFNVNDEDEGKKCKEEVDKETARSIASNDIKIKREKITGNEIKDISTEKDKSKIILKKENETPQNKNASKNGDSKPIITKTIIKVEKDVTPIREMPKSTDNIEKKKVIDSKIRNKVKSEPVNESLPPKKPKVEDIKMADKKSMTFKISSEINNQNKTKSNLEMSMKVSNKNNYFIEKQDMIDQQSEIMESDIQELNDGDEMNDEEILALISEGIVVDEYCGSDED